MSFLNVTELTIERHFSGLIGVNNLDWLEEVEKRDIPDLHALVDVGSGGSAASYLVSIGNKANLSLS